MTWRQPLDDYRLSDRYGDKEPPRTSPHRGTDYVGDKKELVRAVNDGEIIDIYWTNCLGWVCAVRIDGSDWVFSYCHLNCHTHGTRCSGVKAHADGSNCMKNLAVGDKVSSGQPVGRQGGSGSCSRGDHLHLVQGKSRRSAVSGKTWDAYKYIEKQMKRESNERLQGQKEEVTESPQKPEPKASDVTTPEKTKNLPKSVLEALRVITAWFSK